MARSGGSTIAFLCQPSRVLEAVVPCAFSLFLVIKKVEDLAFLVRGDAPCGGSSSGVEISLLRRFVIGVLKQGFRLIVSLLRSSQETIFGAGDDFFLLLSSFFTAARRVQEQIPARPFFPFSIPS